jgi:ATP synthase protein I
MNENNKPRPSRPKSKPNRDLRQVSLLATVPAMLVAAPLVGFFIGKWLDGKFDSEPTAMIIGVILGFASAGLEVSYLVKKSSAIEREKEKEKDESKLGS